MQMNERPELNKELDEFMKNASGLLDFVNH